MWVVVELGVVLFNILNIKKRVRNNNNYSLSTPQTNQTMF